MLDLTSALGDLWLKGDFARRFFNQISANWAMFAGAAGFFALRYPPAWLHPDGALEATSFYDTKLLKGTLERFVDFERINSGETRLSVGAVNVRSGNFVYFDTRTHTIGPEHVVASGSLPPGFPSAEIEGEYYWDGGLISNTPLQWVAEYSFRFPQDILAFQVDLWSSRGEFPCNLLEVATRQKEIQYSSRTRANTDYFKRIHRIRSAVSDLLGKLPPELRDSDEVKALEGVGSHKVYNIIHLIYRAKHYEGHSKDYEFSRLSMQDHWRAGYHDAVRTLRHPEVLERPRSRDGIFIFDFHRDGRE